MIGIDDGKLERHTTVRLYGKTRKLLLLEKLFVKTSL